MNNIVVIIICDKNFRTINRISKIISVSKIKKIILIKKNSKCEIFKR